MEKNNKEGKEFYIVEGFGFGIIGGLIRLIGRLMIASLFITTGVLAMLNFKDFVSTVNSYNLPQPMILAVLGILAKIVGGILFTGILPVPLDITLGKLILLTFTSLATFLAHNPFKDITQLQNMLKNVAVMGGIILG